MAQFSALLNFSGLSTLSTTTQNALAASLSAQLNTSYALFTSQNGNTNFLSSAINIAKTFMNNNPLVSSITIYQNGFYYWSTNWASNPVS